MSHRLASGVDGPTRAAQYLRMSSENQRYSTENQQNAIAEYAEKHDYVVVASYIDAGKSGLSLKGRDALKQLLSDALATPRFFDAILVLDVSRWGRFQNPDQAAHYEFLCRQAGVRVVYVCEPFGDDVAPTISEGAGASGCRQPTLGQREDPRCAQETAREERAPISETAQ